MDPTLRRYINDSATCDKLRCISDKQVLTIQHILSCNVDVLMKIADLSRSDAQALQDRLSARSAVSCYKGRASDLATLTGDLAAQQHSSASTLNKQQASEISATSSLPSSTLADGCSISTGNHTVDNILRGGYPIGMISEVCGPPGVGKTQFCLCACASVLNSNLTSRDNSRSGSSSSNNNSNGIDNMSIDIDASVCDFDRSSPSHIVYFDTELKFDVKRLSQILVHKYPHLSQQQSSADVDSENLLESLLQRVIIRRPTTSKELLSELLALEDTVISCNVKLIVVDSIAALVRKEGATQAEKDVMLCQQTAELKRLADQCRCAVLVTNQVTGGTDREIIRQVSRQGDSSMKQSSWEQHKPALGLSWFHCVSTRLQLEWQAQQDRNINVSQGDIPSKRRLAIVKCPFASHNFDVEYRIDNYGFNVVA